MKRSKRKHRLVVFFFFFFSFFLLSLPSLLLLFEAFFNFPLPLFIVFKETRPRFLVSLPCFSCFLSNKQAQRFWFWFWFWFFFPTGVDTNQFIEIATKLPMRPASVKHKPTQSPESKARIAPPSLYPSHATEGFCAKAQQQEVSACRHDAAGAAARMERMYSACVRTDRGICSRANTFCTAPCSPRPHEREAEKGWSVRVNVFVCVCESECVYVSVCRSLALSCLYIRPHHMLWTAQRNKPQSNGDDSPTP